MKRILSTLLTTCLLAGLACAATVPAGVAGPGDVIAAVAANNSSHGGTGTPGCWYDKKITYDEYLAEMHEKMGNS